MLHFFFNALNLKATDNPGLNQFARKTGIPLERLFYYNRFNVIPSGQDLRLILDAVGISEIELMLKMGIVDSRIQTWIQEKADQIARIIQQTDKIRMKSRRRPSWFGKPLGASCIGGIVWH